VGEPPRSGAWLRGDDGAVERPDRRPDDKVRDDAVFRYGMKHPDLESAKAASATQDEGHGIFKGWPAHSFRT
jgi:hypothetical protein